MMENVVEHRKRHHSVSCVLLKLQITIVQSHQRFLFRLLHLSFLCRQEGDEDPETAGRRVRPLIGKFCCQCVVRSSGDASNCIESARISGSVPADGQRVGREGQPHDPVHRLPIDPCSMAQPPPSPPDSECSSEEDEDGGEDMERAGYEYCAREAIRFLLEEERLDADHPMVRQLRQHFDGQRALDRLAAASGARRLSDDLAPQQ